MWERKIFSTLFFISVVWSHGSDFLDKYRGCQRKIKLICKSQSYEKIIWWMTRTVYSRWAKRIVGFIRIVYTERRKKKNDVSPQAIESDIKASVSGVISIFSNYLEPGSGEQKQNDRKNRCTLKRQVKLLLFTAPIDAIHQISITHFVLYTFFFFVLCSSLIKVLECSFEHALSRAIECWEYSKGCIQRKSIAYQKS